MSDIVLASRLRQSPNPVWRRLQQLPWGSGLFLTLLLIAAIDPHLLTPVDPLAIDPVNAFQPPGLRHFFGTDESGRDIFARVISGARPSLALGLSATLLASAIAILLGLIGGLGGALLERLIGALLDILFSFPTIILALLFAAHLGGGIGPLVVATAIGTAPGYAKLVFGQVLIVRRSGYIEAAKIAGHSPGRIVIRQILPNAIRPLLVMITMGIGQSIVWASSLSFLGLGAQPPAAEWGTMLSMGRDFIAEAWWLTFFPGLFIVLTTLATTGLGRYLQRKLDRGIV